MLKREASKKELIQTIAALRLRLERAEETLRKQSDVADAFVADSEKMKLSALIDSIQDEVWFVDVNGRLVLTNRAVKEESGADLTSETAQEMDSTYEVYRPDGTRRLVEESPPLRALKGETVRNQEEIVRASATGELRHRQVNAAPVRNGKGNIIGSVSVVRDITPIKKAQESLRRSEARWSAAIESFSEGAIIATEDEHVIYWNPAARAMHGFTRTDEGIGRLDNLPVPFQLWTLDGGRMLELDEWPMRRIKRGELVRNLELRIRRPDKGWEKIFLYSGAMVETSEGESLIFLSCCDMTELRRTEESLRGRAEELERLLEAVPAAVWVARDPNGLSIIGNSLANELYEARAGENVSASSLPEARRFFTPDGGELPAEELPMQKAMAANQDVRDVELHVQLSSGRQIAMLGNAVPLRDQFGNARGCIGAFLDITGRKQAEESLRQSEERLRMQMVRMPIGCIVYDERNCVSGLNPAAESIFGYTEPDLRGRHANMLVPEAARPHVDDIMRRLAEGDMTANSVNENLTRDGRIILCRWTNTPLRDAEGRHLGFLSMVQDVTEQQKAEEALRESEQFYRQTLESIPGMVFTTRPDGYCDYQSQQWVDFTGVPMSEHLGDGWSNLLHPEDRPQAYAAWRAAVEERAPYDLEYRVRRRDGHYEWFKVRGAPIRDAAGRIVRWFGVVTNIEAIKRTEEALRKSESRLRLGQQAAKIGAFEWDLQTGLNAWSPEMEIMHGLAPGAFEGTQEAWKQLLHPQDRDRAAAAVRHAFEIDGSAEGEWRVVWPDANVHWVLARFQVSRDPDGKPLRLMGVNIDISERKQAEMELKSALHEKEVLLKEIHHRVKNNMQVISSLVDLQAGQLQDVAARSALQDVIHRVRSMALVHEKLYQSTDMARTDFAEYVQSLLKYLWHSHGAAASGIRLVLHLNPVALPIHTAVPCGLILNELATNALKHAFGGRDGGEVHVSLQVGDQVCMRIRDNGNGLPPGLDWRQAKSLGLRLVQILARQLSATVEVSTGEGTEFSMSFGGTNL